MTQNAAGQRWLERKALNWFFVKLLKEISLEWKVRQKSCWTRKKVCRRHRRQRRQRRRRRRWNLRPDATGVVFLVGLLVFSPLVSFDFFFFSFKDFWRVATDHQRSFIGTGNRFRHFYHRVNLHLRSTFTPLLPVSSGSAVLLPYRNLAPSVSSSSSLRHTNTGSMDDELFKLPPTSPYPPSTF